MVEHTRNDHDYWLKVREMAAALNSDGCTGVPDFYLECCFEHDICWRTGRTPDEEPISHGAANGRFRRCIQRRSRFRWFSPLAWWRWVAVSVAAWFMFPPWKQVIYQPLPTVEEQDPFAGSRPSGA